MTGPRDIQVGQLPAGNAVIAASQATGALKLTTKDAFVEHQTPFDRQARLCLTAEVATVTEAMYLQYVGAQAMDWSPDQVTALQAILTSVASKFAGLQITLPEQIVIVQTTGKEEGYAAYTRGFDTIVLPANMVASIDARGDFGDPLHAGGSTDYLENVVIHELFHLVSKNDPALRRRLYEQVAYRTLGNPIKLPGTPWPGAGGPPMCDLAITNPDGVFLDVAIEMTVPEDPASGDGATVSRWLTPLLLATGPYERGSFFDYLEWWFLAVVESGGRWSPLMRGGLPVIYASSPLMDQYLVKVGRNIVHEIFYPDEILAQSFVLAVNQPSVDRLLTIRQTLLDGAG